MYPSKIDLEKIQIITVFRGKVATFRSRLRGPQQGQREELSRLARPEKSTTYGIIHWIGLRENLQETMVFAIKIMGFSCNFPVNQTNEI